MAARDLPARPHLGQYKKQAKELVEAWTDAEAEALVRVRAHHPRFSESDGRQQSAPFALADAQLVIAREHGFHSWPSTHLFPMGST